MGQFDVASNRLRLGTAGYDAAGNQTADPNGGTAVYDAENRIVSVRKPERPAGGTGLARVYDASYGYDGEGRRVTATEALEPGRLRLRRLRPPRRRVPARLPLRRARSATSPPTPSAASAS